MMRVSFQLPAASRQQDHGEMDRKLTAQKPVVSTGIVNSVTGRDEPTRSSGT